jgi:hypothetical protein
MTSLQTYVLDANVFIEAARRYYAFDIVPPFWQILVNHGNSGRMLSIDRIKNELNRGNDELAEWANNSFHMCFASTAGEDIIDSYRQIMIWSQDQSQYTEGAKAEFASVADAWLVAYALAKGCIVVTHEQFDANIRRRIKIPNVCRAFDVEYVDPFRMMRVLGIRLG